MSSFEVSPADLQALASSLAGLVGDILAASSRVSGSAGSAAQNGELEGAIEGFLGEWRTALQQTQNKLQAVGTKLDGAAAAYAGTDDAVASGFGGG